MRLCRLFLCCMLLLGVCIKGVGQPENRYLSTNNDGSLNLTHQGATHFADLALGCIQKEFPNKLNQTLGGTEDIGQPHNLHPAFYGCFDWHSAVHGHWMLVRLLKTYPDMPRAAEIRQRITENITSEHIAGEVAYFKGKYSQAFERTYGWAWLLKLAEELHTWNDPDAQIWAKALEPLERLMVERYMTFLPKLNYAVRSGEHPNTAFGMTMAWDYAQAVNNQALKQLLAQKTIYFYLQDRNCPVRWEPNGFDFLSPCLEEADMMRRVLKPDAFKNWLRQFIPGLTKTRNKQAVIFEPALVTDRSDGKLVHLDGLNLSRAWCLYNISQVFQGKERRHLVQVANQHINTTLPQVASGDYAGEHWLASFAVYALTAHIKNSN